MKQGERCLTCGLVLSPASDVFAEGIASAIEEANVFPVRISTSDGISSQASLERFLLADFALVDMTSAGASLIHTLGMRDMAKPGTTVVLGGEDSPELAGHHLIRFNRDTQDHRTAISGRLNVLQSGNAVHHFQNGRLLNLVGEWTSPPVARLKTDIFRDQVPGDTEIRAALTGIREKARDGASKDELAKAIEAVRQRIGPLDDAEATSLIDLMLTLRAIGDWDGMITLVSDMPRPVSDQIMVREQLAFAHNRRAGEQDRDIALSILADVEAQQGPSSETCPLIGRVHKDLWQEALRQDDQPSADRHLTHAISAYERGFLADQRDSFPGINLVTLLDIDGTEEALERRDRYLPLVRFAVEQRLGQDDVDYWDYATLLELAVLANDEEDANRRLKDALKTVREAFEPESTANNLGMIRDARANRNEDTGWLDRIIEKLKAG